MIPCQGGDPDLWFAEDPADLEQAKTLCGACPVRRQCLSAALDRAEPWG
ncbi:MAG: WhiB family transcriptional regulator, partial [Mycobacterium sp.]|nr:WhiB family transcriptional regulator [Mycobacterium sp.]